MPVPGLSLRGVRKHFGGVAALRGVDFDAQGGEVHALLGQNGSGKSTLVKVVTGIHAPDDGATMHVWGTPVSMPLTAAHQHGIAVIHQDLGLVDGLTVAENMGVASGYAARLLAPFSLATERRRSRALLADLGADIDPDTLVGALSPAARATVAIARATRVLREHAERFVFILDEPTAYLGADESAQVIRLMRAVADRGSAVVFISHRLQEVEAVADRVTVLRDGLVVDSFGGGEGDQHRIIEAMLGQRLAHAYPDRPAVAPAAPMLRAERLDGERVTGLDLALVPGEIVGFAGLVGMGHEEVPGLLSGAVPARGGRLLLDGEDITTAGIGARIRRGVSLVPGNRQRDGVWLEARASENLALLGDARSTLLAPRRTRAEVADARTAMTRFGVRPPDPLARVGQFSGGNQQKVVLAKWMHEDPRLLLLDEPTQGIDAGAKFDVLQTICDAAARGAMVVVASGDYEQLAHVCHRVLVMRFGRVTAQLSGGELTEAAIAERAQAD
ncbi:MAG: sugar ABC transporter ATP-binding protein [Tetrasphaera sp.]|nr:sugar ABC transporter ATP-binding protein [Tetrasphaera sp.]